MADSTIVSPRVRRWAETVFFAFVAAFFIRTFLLWPFVCQSDMMANSVMNGDRILVEKYSMHTKSFHPGELIVLAMPSGQTYIRRLIAVEGQTIQVVNKAVYVDNVKVAYPSEKYMDRNVYPDFYNSRDNYAATEIPVGKIFVMADNRDIAQDSRLWGPVSKHTIQGRPLFVFWSFKQAKGAPDFSWINPVSWFQTLFYVVMNLGDMLQADRIGKGLE